LKENEEYRYYNAILRNIFFHCLNVPQKDRKEYEHRKLFKNISIVKEQFQKIPFLNGGLFNEQSGDDFPLNNEHFFSELTTRHILELSGDYQVEGIVRILSQYQYKLSIDDLLDREYTQTIDPEFIGKVFESLLSCIDTDSKETRRKVTGSYYTPREIVDYMVSESLDAYLQNNKDLLQCKILDPACGSGAFPCGIMNEIMRRLDPNKTIPQTKRYHQKLRILQNVIHGVDIQPMAVQISALRIFLSLIQEIIPTKDVNNNYGIEPLPNLEMKFVCANALIGLKKEKQKKLELPIIRTTVKQLQETRNQYLTASTLEEKERLQKYDESLRSTLSVAMEDAGSLTHETAELVLQWNPYNQAKSSPFFDTVWMFGVEKFDIVIGNPPYVESRSASVSDDLKLQYQNQVKTDFGTNSQYITRGSDLLIYFFPRSIVLLAEQGVGMLIVQNGWLNTDYGAKAAQFLMKTLQYIKVTDSSFRHFDRASANINTVITRFQKQADKKKVSFDIMEKEKDFIVIKNEKAFDLSDNILSDMRWGIIMSADKDVFSVLRKVIKKGKNIDQSFYTIGQGINVNRRTFISHAEKTKFEQKENLIDVVFKEYQYVYSKYDYFLYHSHEPCKHDITVLETLGAEEFCNGQRKYPSVIMPRGIGTLHFAGLVSGKVLSNSFVDIYLQEEDDEKKLNIWLFCNSSLFFLYRELSGRKNLGGGLLKSEAADIKLFPLYFPIADKETIRLVMKEMGTPSDLQERLKMAIQNRIDDLVFSYFNFSHELRTKITNELLRLFQFRCNKAK
jgi:type I restriction-modification system DNA methylase subunit